LRHVLGLVDRLAEREGRSTEDEALDENALVSSAYQSASPIVQRRFDALAGETAAWAASGVHALLAAKDDGIQPRAAAAGLADELAAALRRLARLVRS
jgi:hypothetical protein